MPLITFSAAFLISLVVTPAMVAVGRRTGLVSRPRTDRWNRGVIPTLGGVGVFAALFLSIGLTGQDAITAHRGLLVGAALMFGLGLLDDIRDLSPSVKLIAQIMIAVLVVFSGYRTGFFESALANILVTVVWLVGITNAVNLLDNMDGLAGGISLVAAGFLSFFFWRSGQDSELLIISIALTGGLVGFLFFNFPPAKIFMGDNGSLLFGFTLASLAIARTPQASNVFAVLGVPILLFALPILDTTFVTITRLMRGQSPTRGGRDHTSHRLVAFGLSERQTVLVLYGIAVLSGAAGALVESFDYTLSLVLIPVLLVSFAVLAAYLSRLKVVETEHREGPLTTILQDLTYRRRLFDIALDFFLISIAYYLAVWTRRGFALTDPQFDLLVHNLPVVIGGTYAAFFLFGLYQGLWRYISTRDLLRAARAVLAAVFLTGTLLWFLFPRSNFSLGVLFLYALFLFFAVTLTRSSFKLLDELSQQRLVQPGLDTETVLIYGATEEGDLALRWLLQDGDLTFRVAGFLDDDPYTWGRRIHEIEVLGGRKHMGVLLETHAIQGVVATSSVENLAQIKEICESKGVWVRMMRVTIEEV